LFTNRSTNEINVRVVVWGPASVGKATLMNGIYDETPADQKGLKVVIPTGARRTIFFDVQRPEFGSADGFRLRLHFYAESGEPPTKSDGRILKNLDALLFLADAREDSQQANRAAYEALLAKLSEQAVDLSVIPHLVCITQCDLRDTDAPAAVASALGVSTPPGFCINPNTGEGIPELLARLAEEVRGAIADKRLREWQPSVEQEQRGREFTARARVVGHYSDHFGQTREEYSPASPVDGLPGFIVVEHGPLPGRPYWTYATAGLSLWQQRPGGDHPRIEFLAYSPVEDARLVDVLMVLARQVQLLEETDVPYNMFDTVTLQGFGLVHETFVLGPPAESEDLLDFPNLATRMKDVRFTHVITGNTDDSVTISFIQVIPVLRDELEFAASSGTPALLEIMDLERRGKGFGWGRGDGDGVLGAEPHR
jgi:signal recognition particle receptor subunit beta